MAWRCRCGRRYEIRQGQTVKFGPSRSGARAYLCVLGGIAVEPFLGSASTHVVSGPRGFEGRALRKGDRVEVSAANSLFRKRVLSPKVLENLQHRKVIRVTEGPQSDWFAESSWKTLCANAFRVSEQSHRMGIRLEGRPNFARHLARDDYRGSLTRRDSGDSFGQPIILFVEHQTTGGYPKIANVISADLHSLGQLRRATRSGSSELK